MFSFWPLTSRGMDWITDRRTWKPISLIPCRTNRSQGHCSILIKWWYLHKKSIGLFWQKTFSFCIYVWVYRLYEKNSSWKHSVGSIARAAWFIGHALRSAAHIVHSFRRPPLKQHNVEEATFSPPHLLHNKRRAYFKITGAICWRRNKDSAPYNNKLCTCIGCWGVRIHTAAQRIAVWSIVQLPSELQLHTKASKQVAYL